MGRFLQIAGLGVGLTGLILQFAITIPASMAVGRSLLGSIVFYFSFFTILTNIAAVLVHVALLSSTRHGWLSALGSPRRRAGIAVAISVVAIVYLAVLAPLGQPRGLFLLCDILLHYLAPPLFVLWWLTSGADGTSRWADIATWLSYPALYVVYVLARAPIAGEVPYPFLNPGKNGYGAVAAAALGVAALFVTLGVCFVAADKIIGQRRAGKAQPS